VRSGRTDPEQITLFNSVGLALQDVATARQVVTDALAAGVGTEVALY
jgi:ornithine cyclodeaminase/alanine dehydrogenase